MIAVANLGLSYARPERLIQRLASGVIIAAPVPLVTAFFLDSARGVHGSPWTTFTMRALFVAAALLSFAHRPALRIDPATDPMPPQAERSQRGQHQSPIDGERPKRPNTHQ